MMHLPSISSACLLVFGSLASAHSGPVQDTTAVATETTSASADEGVMRLMHLRDGSVLRARARSTGGLWEIQDSAKSWLRLPEGTVQRTTLERDALADARRLEQAIASGPRQEQNSRRVSLADWMVKQGLIQEALAQLDRVLAADPDQRQALVLVQTLAPQLDVAAIDAALASDQPTLGVLRAAVTAAPTLREVAIQRLASSGPTEELRAELLAQLTSHSPRLRALAALALRRIYPGPALRMDEVRELIQRSVLDDSDVVRCESARALRDTQDARVALSAMKALGSSYPRVRENSIQALGVMGFPAAVEPLITYLSRINAAGQAGKSGGVAGGSIFIGTQTAYIQDFDVEVANGSAIADPQVNVLVEGSVLDARVMGVYTASFTTEARLVRTALADLTGAKLANSNRAWLDWWDANQANWKSQQTPPRGSASTPPPEANGR